MSRLDAKRELVAIEHHWARSRSSSLLENSEQVGHPCPACRWLGGGYTSLRSVSRADIRVSYFCLIYTRVKLEP